MKNEKLFHFLDYREDWSFTLDIRGNYESVKAIYMVVSNEPIIITTIDNVDFEEAWLAAIDFCKFYEINRDKVLVRAKRAFDEMLSQFGEGWLIVSK